jgi:hypothetical protein
VPFTLWKYVVPVWRLRPLVEHRHSSWGRYRQQQSIKTKQPLRFTSKDAHSTATTWKIIDFGALPLKTFKATTPPNANSCYAYHTHTTARPKAFSSGTCSSHNHHSQFIGNWRLHSSHLRCAAAFSNIIPVISAAAFFSARFCLKKTNYFAVTTLW